MPTELSTPISAPRIATTTAVFIALAILNGPATNYSFPIFSAAINSQELAATSLSSVLAGAVLLLICITRKQPLLRTKQWPTLFLLFAPQLLASFLTPQHLQSTSWLRPIPSGTIFLLALAAPLWLALLSALQLISIEVPRTIVGAAIAGIFAVCLVIPTDAYAITPHQLPTLALQLLLNILIVFTWTYAAPRLVGTNAFAVAGSFLLLSALSNFALSFLFERSAWQPIDWRAAALPLLLHASVIAFSWCLWFWLLQHITLAAFGMRDLATWTATLIPLLASASILDWRIDLALTIALAALIVSLCARPTEEQPTALGLRDS